MKITNDLNLNKQAKEYGLKIWQTPGFLLLLISFVGLFTMFAVYFLSGSRYSPEFLVAAECVIASLVMIISYVVVKIINQVVKLNKIKSEFVSVASHQLRTPLSAICWETELLLSKFKKGLSKKQIDTIEEIGDLAERMTRLVNDLLDVTRIDQKRLVMRKELVDIVRVINDQIKELSPLAKARNVQIVFSAKTNVPEITADGSRIKMVVENLLSNSIKYTTNRGKVEIKVIKKDKYIITSVKDNGVGIPEEQIGRVFEKFFRSDNAVKYQTDGTGLGLYIAKNIVEQSGGKIWFQSVENLGSVFSFSLPIKN